MVYAVDGKEHKSSWIAALSRWNAGKGVWCTPRKGTPEHAQVKAIQNSMTRNGPNMYRDSEVVAMPKREPAMRTATAQYVTLESTKERPAREVAWAPPPKAKKRAVMLTSVADVVDVSDANGPWEDVDERSGQARAFDTVTKRLRSKEWRKQQIRKYGKVREYGKRASIKKKRKRVKT